MDEYEAQRMEKFEHLRQLFAHVVSSEPRTRTEAKEKEKQLIIWKTTYPNIYGEKFGFEML